MTTMADYKDTLNLPQTKFPMKANLANREPNILKHWHEIDLYQQLRLLGKKRERFIMHDGPPYANGRPHLGTALNKTLKDIVVKSKTLSGFDVPFVPGWDCHGLPIELNVEKKKGKPGTKLSPKEFRQACRDYAKQQVKLQSEDFQRLGIIGDWGNPYLTMNFKYEADTVRVLAKIIANGHLQRGQKPVHWCTDCASALAEAEVEYRDKASPSIYVRFDAVDADAFCARFDCQSENIPVTVPIWTTTPWTLPANEAVCLNPKLHYALVKCDVNSEPLYLVLAKDLVDQVMQALDLDDYAVHGNITGDKLENLKLAHPFIDKTVPIILGDHVTTDAGTGNVHTAPAHGQDDYVVAGRYDIPVNSPVNSRSCFIDGTPLVAGLHVFKANEPIVVALADSGKLLHQEKIQHSYPHCWRHKTPLIFRATPQWFISMDKNNLRKMGLEAITTVKWIPKWGESRIGKMIESRPDWCISRQRTWGIPITLFVHHETGELHPNTPALMEQVANLIEKDSVDAWFDCDPITLLGDEAEDYDKVTDTLDVWFDSGSTHYCVLEQRSELSVPADLYLEGSDQHRGWFQSSLLTSLAIREAPPFKTVLTHGYVVDGKGLKMSKSVGNTILPADVVKNLGADILRLWTAASDFTGDINVSDEILKRSADAYRRIRNTARFLLSNLSDFDPTKDCVSEDQLVELDRWAILEAITLQDKILKAYENYHFQSIYQLISNFCTVEMGSFYLDIIKDRQYTAKKDSIARRSAQTAMYYIAEALVRWLAPILSFTAEEIWQQLPGKRQASVFLSTWFTEFPKIKTADEDYWRWFMSVRDEVNKVLETRRNEGDIRSALDAEVRLYGNDELCKKLSRLGDELRFALITSEASISPAKKSNGSEVISEIEGLTIEVNVSKHKKCVRCWQRREDVGSDKEHPELCERCVVNVIGEGETRQFA